MSVNRKNGEQPKPESDGERQQREEKPKGEKTEEQFAREYQQALVRLRMMSVPELLGILSRLGRDVMLIADALQERIYMPNDTDEQCH